MKKNTLRRLIFGLGAVVAVSACQTTSQTTPDSDMNAKLGNSLEEAATASEMRGDYATAASYFGSLYRRNPGDLDSLIGMSRNLRHLSRASEARAVLKRALRERPEEPHLLGELGKVELSLGEPSAALDYLSRANISHPDDWQVLSAMGIAYDRLGIYDQAETHYLRALELSPENIAVLNNLGLSLAQAGRLADAVSALERAVGQPETTPQIRQNLALLYAMKGDLPATEKLVRQDLPSDMATENMSYYQRLHASVQAGGDLPALSQVTTTVAPPPELAADKPPAVPQTPVYAEAIPNDPTQVLVAERPAIGAAPTPDADADAPARMAGLDGSAPVDIDAQIDQLPFATSEEDAPEVGVAVASLDSIVDFGAQVPPPAVSERLAPPAAPGSQGDEAQALIDDPTPAPTKVASLHDDVDAHPDLMAVDPAGPNADRPVAAPGDAAMSAPPATDPFVAAIDGASHEAGVGEGAQRVATLAAAGGFRVQLGSFRKADAAERSIGLLRTAHGDVLAGLPLDIAHVTIADRGDFYRVLTAPLAARASAIDLCARLRSRNADCVVVAVR